MNQPKHYKRQGDIHPDFVSMEVARHGGRESTRTVDNPGPGDIQPWTPSISQVRDALLAYMIVGTGFADNMLPPEALSYAPDDKEVGLVALMAHDAVSQGRLIDFGDWTNDVIKYGGTRGGPMYNRGLIGHPFRDPYVFRHSWEGVTAVYLVNLLEPELPSGGDCEVMELQPLDIRGNRGLFLGDRGTVLKQPDSEEARRKYHCSATPASWRFLDDTKPLERHAAEAAGNVLDPLMCALLILSTRGIPRTTVSADAKLQRSRIKSGKRPIPPHDVVDASGYVTAIMNRKARGREMSKGGTHASPVFHLRMGHVREYANGTRIFVRDALVNATPEARANFKSDRLHYSVR